MKILTLIIKQQHFDDILSGSKPNEFREIRPKNANKYIVDDGVSEITPVQYDAIRFYVGYNKNRSTALIEVKDAQIEIITDEDGKDVVYEESGQEYLMAQMNYSLGKRLE